jgi:replication factor C subunit 2/4
VLLQLTLAALLRRPARMTAGAQQALRRTMEIYSNTTRFALACNMSNKIIEPIQSRCAILRYAKLTDLEVLKRLLEVCEAEKVRRSGPRARAIPRPSPS